MTKKQEAPISDTVGNEHAIKLVAEDGLRFLRPLSEAAPGDYTPSMVDNARKAIGYQAKVEQEWRKKQLDGLLPTFTHEQIAQTAWEIAAREDGTVKDKEIADALRTTVSKVTPVLRQLRESGAKLPPPSGKAKRKRAVDVAALKRVHQAATHGRVEAHAERRGLPSSPSSAAGSSRPPG